MNTRTTNKLIAYLALLSGLTLSVVAEYYSIIGLTTIFAGAQIPIIVMGVALGVSKIVSTVWLKQNWTIAPNTIKGYLIVSILILMLITSMGIFGFLSKSHIDQGMPSGEIAAQIFQLDEKIKNERETIDANRKTLAQLDAAVDQIMARSTTEEGATKSTQIRRSQQKERSQLLTDNERSQKLIVVLSAEKAPLAGNLRKVEAEVGPIKYIAAFIYGSEDSAILEKSVTWIILIIIFVFDPLAVILLLSSQISFQKIKEDQEITTLNSVVPYNEIPLEVPIARPIRKKRETKSKTQVADLKEVVETLTPNELNTLVHELRESNPELFNSEKTYDWESIPEGTEYVTIDGQKMSVRAGKALYPQSIK